MKVVLDIEANGFLREATEVWCIVAKELGKDRWWVFDHHDLGSQLYLKHPRFPLKDFKKFSKDIQEMIGHNLLGYDLLVLDRLLGVKFPVSKVTDTLVMSLMFNPDRKDKHGMHSLDAWGSRLGTQKQFFKDFHEYTEKMLGYCIQDVKVNERTYYALVKEGKKQPKEALRVEHSVYYLMKKASEDGIDFDVERAHKLQAKLKQKATILEREVMKLWPTAAKPYKKSTADKTYTPKYKADGSLSKVGLKFLGEDIDLEEVEDILEAGSPCTPIEWEKFNLGSTKQVINKLNAVGWEPYIPTDRHQKLLDDMERGKKVDQEKLEHFKVYGWKVNEENLATVSKNAPKPVKALARWRMLTARINTLDQWLDAVADDGKIHGEFFPIGTNTHRMRHRNPNLGNIPGANAPYGLECRKCFYVPEDDYYMVGTDAFKLELGCIANETQDKDLIGALSRREDMWEVLKELIGLPDKGVTKTTTYAYCYGAQNKRLGSVSFGGGEKEGKEVRAKIRQNIPNLQNSVDSANDQSRRFGKVKAIDGRWLQSRAHHSSFNLRMQGNGAIICKRWLLKIMRQVYKENLDVTLLLAVHDEYQFKVHKDVVDRFKVICEETIAEVGRELEMSFPLMADVDVGKNWAECH